ncbi:MAG: type II/IV secretion system ATPase subunit [Desulfurococcales archaeon]|nr:type II/IV secretion system ATPase subunit [Desulfurococcales archaeon]
MKPLSSLRTIFSTKKINEKQSREQVPIPECPPGLYKYGRDQYKYSIVSDGSSIQLKICGRQDTTSRYSKLHPLIIDENIEEIVVPGPGKNVYVVHKLMPGAWIDTEIKFTKEELDSLVFNLASMIKRNISLLTPMAEGLTPEGHRVSLTYSDEISRWGSSIVIRKYPEKPIPINKLVATGMISALIVSYLWFLIENKRFIIIAGDMGSGKTTLLRALADLIPPYYRVLTIEDTPELRLTHPRWEPLISRPSYPGADFMEVDIHDLVKFSLRRRTDYIIVGEVRGIEAKGLAQAVASGQGSMTTIHADSPSTVMTRFMMEPISLPEYFLKLIDVIVQMKRIARGGSTLYRRVVEVAEVIEGVPQTVFKWNPYLDIFTPQSSIDLLGKSVLLRNLAEKEGLSLPEIRDDLDSRISFINKLVEKDAETIRGDIGEFYSTKLS